MQTKNAISQKRQFSTNLILHALFLLVNKIIGKFILLKRYPQRYVQSMNITLAYGFSR